MSFDTVASLFSASCFLTVGFWQVLSQEGTPSVVSFFLFPLTLGSQVEHHHPLQKDAVCHTGYVA